LVGLAAHQVDADSPVVGPIVRLLAHQRHVDAVPRRVDGDLLLAALAVGGDPVDDEVAPFDGDGSRRPLYLRPGIRPLRRPAGRAPGGWADSIAPAAPKTGTWGGSKNWSLTLEI